MNDDPSTVVCELLIAGKGVPEVKVTPDARILHDLGDDAGELFRALNERLGTDFAELTYQWSLFFNAEGASPRAILFGILAIVIFVSAAGALAAALHWPALTARGLVRALLVGGRQLFSRWFGRELRPLTLAGLAEIVQAARWPADPSDVR